MLFMWQTLWSQGMMLQIIWKSILQWKLTHKYSKIYLFDRQKIQTGGKLHKCVRCGKDLILCSGLTHHHLTFLFQYCDGFCCTSTWVGHRHTYVPSLLNPPLSPPYSSRLSQSTCSYIKLQLALLHMIICEELTHWKRLWCWEGLGVGGEGDYRGWDGWMASLTRWMWVWVNSRSWWWTGRPGVLRSMGSQRIRQDWATELNWTEYICFSANLLNPAILFLFFFSIVFP